LDGKVIAYMTRDERDTHQALRRRSERLSYDADECVDEDGTHHQGCGVLAAYKEAVGDLSRFETAMTRKYGRR
jgi:hypothetical protein